MHYIGAHTIDNGGIHMAVRRAGAAGMKAMQLFTAIPKFYNDRSSIRPERAQRFREELAGSGIPAEKVMAHAAYVLNVATPDAEKWTRARDGLAKELERSTELGLGMACFHPGAATDGDRERAIESIAEAIVFALEAHPGSRTRLLVENTAGAGNTMAKTPEEIGAILRNVPKRLRPRTGYGLDTCHLFSSGYDISASRAALGELLDAFEESTGEPPSFFHLNDSEGELGSNRDRHVLIGDGRIGTDAFEWLLGDPRSEEVPLILETPQLDVEIGGDDATPDPYDIQMLELLTRLSRRSRR
jgi:deoxyribonuclease IV